MSFGEQPGAAGPAAEERRAGGAHSRWAMVACCVPMLAIAAAIAIAGGGIALLAIALACTAMMAAMMRGSSKEG